MASSISDMNPSTSPSTDGSPDNRTQPSLDVIRVATERNPRATQPGASTSQKRTRTTQSKASYEASSQFGELSSEEDLFRATIRPQAINRERDNLQDLSRADETSKRVPLPYDEAVSLQARAEVALDTHDYGNIFQEYGYTALTDAAYAASKKAKHPHFANNSKLSKLSTWRTLGLRILTSCPRAMLEAVLRGDLAWLVKQNRGGDVAKYYDTSDADVTKHAPWATRAGLDFAPAIYVRMLVDEEGEPLPTPALRVIIERLRQYVSGDGEYDEQNAEIDNQTRTRSDSDRIAEGYHFHLNGNINRVVKILAFCKALERLLNEAEADSEGSTSFDSWKFVLKYFGYSVSANERFRQHESSSSTNSISALVIDICKREWRDENNVPIYSMQTFPICYLASLEECQIGEELFTRIGGGYYYTGRGFNIAPAGVSVGSANLENENHQTAQQNWKQCRRFRRSLGFILEHMDREEVMLPEYGKFGQSRAKDDVQAKKRERLDELREQSRKLAEETAEMNEKLEAALQKLEESHTAFENSFTGREDVKSMLRDVNSVFRKTLRHRIDQLKDRTLRRSSHHT